MQNVKSICSFADFFSVLVWRKACLFFEQLDKVIHCSVACGIFPDQGWKPCLLRWRAILYAEPLGKPTAMFVCVK